jgi:hypothetical protein
MQRASKTRDSHVPGIATSPWRKVNAQDLRPKSQPAHPSGQASKFTDLQGVVMNQSLHPECGMGIHADLMASAIHHLRNAMETGSRRSCAVACLLFSCLARDESLGSALCEECRGLGDSLEGLSDQAAWGIQP